MRKNYQKTSVLGLWEGEMELKSRVPERHTYDPYLEYMPWFHITCSLFAGKLCEEQSQKMRKTDQKNTWLGLWEAEKLGITKGAFRTL